MKAASETCDRVLPAIQELAIPYFAALRNLLLARIRLFEGSAKEAQTVLEEGLAYAQALDNPWLTAQALHLLGHVGRALDSPHDAEDRHHQALVIQMSYGFVVDAVDALEAISGLAIVGESWAEGVRLGAAMSVVRNAIGASRPANDETRQAEDFERARTALGEEAFAKAWTEGTLLTLEQAVAYATRARGERRRPSSGWASLTPTEEEVVRLAAQGLTNPDIAEQLFISRATVKTHLAHVFTKLGVSTRAELAAEATRRHI
jgi:DNA-binding CsgD family transcriptional regulator